MENESLLLSIWAMLFAIAFLLFYRNNLVHTIELKALKLISCKADDIIAQGYFYSWEHLFKLTEKQTYNHKVLDLTKWSLEDFYPELADKANKK